MQRKILDEFGNDLSSGKSIQPSEASLSGLDTSFQANGYKSLVHVWSIRRRISNLSSTETNFEQKRRGLLFVTFNMSKNKDISSKSRPAKDIPDEEKNVGNIASELQISLLFKFDNFENHYDSVRLSSDYFEEVNILKKLPGNKNNSCFCDSLFVTLLYCCRDFVKNIITESKNSSSNGYNFRFQKAVSLLGKKYEGLILQKAKDWNSHESELYRYLHKIKELTTIDLIYKRNNSLWLEIINAKASAETRISVENLRNFYSEMTSDKDEKGKLISENPNIPKTTQGVVGDLFGAVVTFGKAKDILLPDFFSKIDILPKTSTIELNSEMKTTLETINQKKTYAKKKQEIFEGLTFEYWEETNYSISPNIVYRLPNNSQELNIFTFTEYVDYTKKLNSREELKEYLKLTKNETETIRDYKFKEGVQKFFTGSTVIPIFTDIETPEEFFFEDNKPIYFNRKTGITATKNRFFKEVHIPDLYNTSYTFFLFPPSLITVTIIRIFKYPMINSVGNGRNKSPVHIDINEIVKLKNFDYEICGIICYSGNSISGHYWCYFKTDTESGIWYKHDDTVSLKGFYGKKIEKWSTEDLEEIDTKADTVFLRRKR